MISWVVKEGGSVRTIDINISGMPAQLQKGLSKMAEL